ncbi:MAG: hypothetical protein ACJAQT_002425 [Akkermansiaceae bacterium]|jgi:hypothetical protein
METFLFWEAVTSVSKGDLSAEFEAKERRMLNPGRNPEPRMIGVFRVV